ncbi:MAG: proton-conducting transporter transmembrane domain-containing protein, partial [Verrucomicrobiota bacterium]
VSIVRRETGGDDFSNFCGLVSRFPSLAGCMAVFMLSLAGIPPLAGFFGKFYVFAAVVHTGAPNLGLIWLVVLAIAMSAVSLYYYLQVLKRIYVADVPAGQSALRIPALSQFILVLLALGAVVLGCAPGLLLQPLQRALQSAGF